MTDQLPEKDKKYKGHDVRENIRPGSARISVFYDDAQLTFLYKKTERLTAALYLVTNLLSATEPARLRLRERALTILSDVLSFTTKDYATPHPWAHALASAVAEVAAILDVARIAGIISEMNATVLTREYELLVKTARDYADTKAVPRGHVFLPEEFFAIDPAISAAGDKRGRIGPEDAAVFDKSLFDGGGIHAPLAGSLSRPSSGSRHSLRAGTSPEGRAGGRRVNRRESILSLLRNQRNISVKDAARAIPGCSEKTLQRELLAMVAEGVVVKEGERRWSTYTLRAI